MTGFRNEKTRDGRGRLGTENGGAPGEQIHETFMWRYVPVDDFSEPLLSPEPCIWRAESVMSVCNHGEVPL
jgi:hypothetical protein